MDHLTHAETTALGVGLAAFVGFGAYGFTTGAPSTVAYLFIVLVVGALVVALRRMAIPAPLVIGLAVLAVAHLAGGLIQVGDRVLYNVSFGGPAFRYDHFVHAFGVFLGTVMLWTLLLAPAAPRRQGAVVMVCVLAGLGLGALNETIEFVVTLVNSGSHVGGYTNTGWDLVSNVIGGLAGGLVVNRAQHSS